VNLATNAPGYGHPFLRMANCLCYFLLVLSLVLLTVQASLCKLLANPAVFNPHAPCPVLAAEALLSPLFTLFWPIWPVHEKYNGKEYTTSIEEAWDQPGDVGQRGRVAVDNP